MTHKIIQVDVQSGCVVSLSLSIKAIFSILMSRNIVAESTIFFAANVVGLFGASRLNDVECLAASQVDRRETHDFSNAKRCVKLVP